MRTKPSMGSRPTSTLPFPNGTNEAMLFSGLLCVSREFYRGRNIWDDPRIEKSQDQDQGQGQDHLLPQRAALPQFLVLALSLVLVLRFFNYRVVPDIPSLISSPGAWGGLQTVQGAQKKQPPGPKKGSRNGPLQSQKTNRRHESA